MRYRLALVVVTLAVSIARADAPAECSCDVTAAACDAGCACDLECEVDWSVDECAAPNAGCLPSSTVPDEAKLEAMEAATVMPADPIEWSVGDVTCPDGATNAGGRCPAAAAVAPRSDDSGGCAAASPGWLVAAAVIALVAVGRRRRALLLAAIVACTVGDSTWDAAVDAGPTADTRYADVFVGDAAAGTRYLLAGQPLDAGVAQPVAQFGLARAADEVAIARVPGACGDRLATEVAAGDELLGWARARPGDGTAALVELAAPDGCTFVYETDSAAIDARVASGYAIARILGYVWPPGRTDAPITDSPMEPLTSSGPTPCTLGTRPALDLFYSSPGDTYALRFLIGCPGEVVIGDKHEAGPHGAMHTAAAHAAGGRTGFVLDRHGDKLRALLARSNGFERTVAYLKQKLASGYDYIVLDEVTAAPDYADGQGLNRALRALLLRLPPRTFIPYISIDLTQEAGGFSAMIDRKYLLRRFKQHARVMALEVYLHTDSVMHGAAPSTFRGAADRLQDAVASIRDAGGMNLRAITTLGATHQSPYPQYLYLDDPSHDLSAITREINALRGASHRTRQQHGIGWYFVGSSDLAPVHGYTFDQLVARMRAQGLRFR